MSALAQERPYLRSVGDEPLPGYRLIAPLGMGGFGEVWKCVAPGGLHKAIKFVAEDTAESDGAEPTSLQQEYDAFERVKAIRHPFLLTIERVELVGGELVMVMELADRSLGHRYEECRAAGEAGIPRTELLSYMVDAAEALDVLGRQHGLQHLDVKPANLFLLGGHVKVGDYGLVARHRTGLSGEEPKLGRGLTPKYVAPEILSDRVHARSDQYPLALVYQELLTGVFPYSGRTARLLLAQHTSAEPDLTALPFKDREAVGRALSKEPALRFPTCLSFVKALLRENASDGTHVVSATTRTPLPVPVPVPPPRLSPVAPIPPLVTPGLRTHAGPSVEATQRFLPAAERIEAAGPSDHAAEFDLAHPGWKYMGEWPSSARGRVVRIADTAGDLHLAHMLKIPLERVADCGPMAESLTTPLRGVFQTVIRPHAHALSFAVPEAGLSLKEYLSGRNKGGPAEPAPRRAEIRAVLTPLAETLDALAVRCGFPHALVSPATVIRNGAGSGLTLYGVGELLRRTRDNLDWMQAEAHAAPEALAGRAGPASDQYSLALLFLELSGAWTAPERRTTRSGSFPVPVPRIDRSHLLECESAAVRKATSTRPEDRFRTCAEFLAALVPPAVAGVTLEEVRAVESLDRLAGRPCGGDPPAPEELTDAILRAAGGHAVASWPSSQSPCLAVRLPDGSLSMRCPVKLTPETARLKLKAFEDEHGLELSQWTADTFALKPKPGTARAAVRGIELVAQLPRGDRAGGGELVLIGRATGGGDRSQNEARVLPLLERFRRAVQNAQEQRRAARFRTEMPIAVFPVDDELVVGAPIAGVCRDVSGTGFACVLSSSPTAGHAFVTFPSVGDCAPWGLLAKVVRVQTQLSGSTLLAGRFVHAGV